MVDSQNLSEINDVTLQLFKRILEITDNEKLDLLEQLGKAPVQELSLGDRDSIRRIYDRTITFFTQNRQYRALCRNISHGGIFIQTSEIFRLGQLVTLDIPFSNGKKTIKVPAEIVRVNSNGIGLQFIKKETKL